MYCEPRKSRLTLGHCASSWLELVEELVDNVVEIDFRAPLLGEVQAALVLYSVFAGLLEDFNSHLAVVDAITCVIFLLGLEVHLPVGLRVLHSILSDMASLAEEIFEAGHQSLGWKSVVEGVSIACAGIPVLLIEEDKLSLIVIGILGANIAFLEVANVSNYEVTPLSSATISCAR